MTTLDLIQSAPVALDRIGWARRGDPKFAGDRVLAVEVVNGDLQTASETLDAFAVACGGPVIEVQRVSRRKKHVVYALVKEREK